MTNEATITVHPNPVADFTASLTCDGAVTRFTSLSAIEQGYIKSYSWQFGDGSQSSQLHPVKQYYNVDTYQASLTVVSGMNCSGTVTRPVTVHPNPVSGFRATDNCEGAPTRFTNTSTVRSGEGLTYRWTFGDETEDALPSPEHLYGAAGAYRVKLTATTANGQCRDSVERDIDVYPLPLADAGRDTAISAGHGVRLQATGGVGYVWSPHEGLSSGLVANPFANPERNTLYTVTVTDEHGCVNTAQVNVFINNDFKIHPYNVITPDGNGENDTWQIGFIESYPNAKVRIINRWGEEVFYSDHYSNAGGWKGANRNGDTLPEGTYYYTITLDGDDKIYKGHITLLRK
jgi:gliding motility-associated-like protein